MQPNYRGIVELLIIAIIAILLVVLLAHPAGASDITPEDLVVTVGANESAVIADYGFGKPLDYIPRIAQGDDVYVNDTIDISGVVGWRGTDGEYRIAWYGPYETTYSPVGMDPKEILVLPGQFRSENVSSQYHYYFDPAYYSERTGYWYQFISNVSAARGEESAGNLRAFRVVARHRNVTNATSNETEGYYLPGNYTEKVIKPAPLLPERHVADYVAARGQPIEWPPGGYRLWMFGRVDGIYDDRDNVITNEQIQNFEPGEYTLLVHVPGNNTIFEASLENGTILPGLYGRQPIDIRGKLPSTVLSSLREILAGTDDSLYEYVVDLKDPYLTIERADEMFLENRTVLDVRGYTNVANGTPLTVTLDEGKTYYKFVPLWTVNTTAVRDSPGNLSYYRAYVPVDWENLAADARNHTLTARTSIGGSMQKDFKISVMPADSYKPNASLKYIESSIPFIPTPTPEVIIKEIKVPGPKETIIVTTIITPDVQDYGKVVEGGVWWIGTWIAVGMMAMIAIMVIGYLAWVWYRGRKE